MKKTLSILFATVLIFTFAFLLSSCNKEASFNVNFIVDGEVYNTVSTKGKETITLPNDPVKEGYAFEGWYRDNETWQKSFTDSSLLDESLSKDIKVYAKFKVSYDTGNLIYSIKDTVCAVTGVKDNTVSEIVIPDYVTKINTGAFASCANLTNIEVEKNNTNYISIDGNLYDINCTQLIKYAVAKKDAVFSIPDTVTSIGNSAFSNCTSLITVIIPSSVTSIDYYAFFNCYKLFEVINHSSLKMTTGSTKYGLVAQNALEVHNGESKIINSNGYLFYTSGNNNYLIGYSGNETDITLPANYNNEDYAISSYAFYDCTNLRSVKISDNVTSIGESAFKNCSSLESITIPFVGASKDETSKTHFGYIFGALENFHNDDYVPSSLKNVIITNGNSIGAYAFSYCSMLKSIKMSNGITSIGEASFEVCKGLTDITIPDSVTSIGNSAFRYCSSLTSVTLSENITSIGSRTFVGCSSLTSINLPESITSIEEYTFSDCSSLANITLPEGIIRIEEHAFGGCSSLTSITLPNNLAFINNAFYDCSSLTYNEYDNGYYLGSSANPYLLLVKAKSPSITACDIHENTKFIHGNAFMDCLGLTSITIPDGVTNIGFAAFKGCSNLESITIPSVDTHFGYIFGGSNSDSVPSNLQTVVITNTYIIDQNAFSNCLSLKNVIIKSGNAIGKNAFSSCTSLENVAIPDSVTEFQLYSFSHCTSLKSISIPDSMKIIGIGIFSSCTSLKCITIPEGVTTIGGYAFYNCSSLTNVTIPNSVTSIGNYAFDGCSSLIYNEYDNAYYLGNDTNPYLLLVKAKNTSITSCKIHEDTKFIYNSAFKDCSNLESITIPDSVTSIGNSAFEGCTSLERIKTPYFGGHFGFLFGASSYSDNPEYVPSSLKTVEITSGDNIASFAFYKCSNLTKIIISNNITNIGNFAFNECTNLVFNEYDNAYYLGNDINPYLLLVKAKNTSINSCNINKDTKFINSEAFSNCISLTSITIPKSVTHIGNSAFLGCSSLKSATFETASGWSANETSLSPLALKNNSTAAKYLNDTYYYYTWTRK